MKMMIIHCSTVVYVSVT